MWHLGWVKLNKGTPKPRASNTYPMLNINNLKTKQLVIARKYVLGNSQWVPKRRSNYLARYFYSQLIIQRQIFNNELNMNINGYLHH